MTRVFINEFTDPSCPWAFSAEPQRLRLNWTYGDAIDWTPRMVVLSEDPADIAKRFTPDTLGQALQMIGARFGMPIRKGVPERLFASKPACEAVVATRLNEPGHAYTLLRELRKRCFGGDLIDEPKVIADAAESVGIDAEALTEWSADEKTAEALARDKADARDPTAAALALKRKLAEWEGGWRYTCPSYEFSAEDSRLSAPGFQPYESYEAAVANLAPELAPNPPADSAAEALEWARANGEGSLATVEVAALMGQEHVGPSGGLEGVVADLESTGAKEHKVGTGSFWDLEGR